MVEAATDELDRAQIIDPMADHSGRERGGEETVRAILIIYLQRGTRSLEADVVNPGNAKLSTSHH
jgi:ribosomal protein L27